MSTGPPSLPTAVAVTLRVIEEVRQRQVRPLATYRLQLHSGFTLRDAAAIVPYLHDLGVSHVYCSPYLRAKAGSTHGYDTCDHSQIDPQLGGEEAHREFVAALQQHGMGHILDFVPNHMAASPQNPWWLDVLENGPNSPYAHFFDIDWQPVKQELESKILLPVLGGPYGDVLEQGQLQIEYQGGAFLVRYYQLELPLGPKSVIPSAPAWTGRSAGEAGARACRADRAGEHHYGLIAHAAADGARIGVRARAAARERSAQAAAAGADGGERGGASAHRTERAGLQRTRGRAGHV
jgi:maltooligosyltrehalose synthase